MLLGAFVFGQLGDMVQAKGLLPLTLNRFIFNSIGTVQYEAERRLSTSHLVSKPPHL